MLSCSLLALTSLLGGCAPSNDSAEMAVCRQALPALNPPGATLRLLGQSPLASVTGVRIDYTATIAGSARGRMLECRFAPGDASALLRLESVRDERRPLSVETLFFLRRFWLATSDAHDADPSGLAAAQVPVLPRPLVVGLQQALNALPLAATYAVLAASYALIYGLVGRIVLAFGSFAAIGGYATVLAVAFSGPAGIGVGLIFGLVLAGLVAALHGGVAGRLLARPMTARGTQSIMVATIGLAIALDEYLRIAEAGTIGWLPPLLSQPLPLARAGTFVATISSAGLLDAGLALAAAASLYAMFRLTRFGRDWRAVADDPGAASLMGVDPHAILRRAFVLACGLAGLTGFTTTLAFGRLGYETALTLGLKALIGAVLGGIGSVGGALLGGLIVGAFETAWSATFSGLYRDVAVYATLAIALVLRAMRTHDSLAQPEKRRHIDA